jgi:hypothetical protein
VLEKDGEDYLDLSCEKEEILKNTKRKKNIIPTIK